MSARRLVALAVLVAVGATPSGPHVRAAEANRGCDNNQDVTVVVDFASLGGDVNLRCAPQPVDNGFEALRRANISYEQSGGFLCRVAGKPESGECTNRPSSGPYWGYWHAKRGGEWKYSNYGAGARTPPPGSLDGWAYTDGDGPATPPRYPVPAAASPPTTTSHPATPTSASPIPASVSTPGTRGTTSTAVVAPTTSTSSNWSASGVESTAQADQFVTTTTVVALGNVDLSADPNGGGTSGGFLASMGALAVVGAAAIAVARRRRAS